MNANTWIEFVMLGFATLSLLIAGISIMTGVLNDKFKRDMDKLLDDLKR